MVRIVNIVMASPKCETPASVPDNQTIQTDSSAGRSEGREFAKRLKDFQNENVSETQVKDKGDEDKDKKDNGRQSNSDILNAIYGIAGILEGFGSLSYQQNNQVTENTTTGSGTQAAVQADIQKLADAVKAGTDQENGLLEQIAWMLQTKQTGDKPVQTQDEILKTIGEYLDSLENTSKDASEQNAQADGAVNIPKIILNAQDETNNIKNAVNAASESEKKSTETGELLTKSFEKSDAAANVTPSVKGATADVKNDTAVKPAVTNTESLKTSTDEHSDDSGKKDLNGSSAKLASRQEKAGGRAAGSVNTNNGEGFGSKVNTAIHTESETAAGTAGGQNVAGTMRENVTRIVESVKTKASEGNYQFDIELKPDFLGKVSIKLSMKDDNLKVQIKADDPAVKAMLSDQTSSLQNMFKEKGITVSNIEITYDNPGMQYSEGQMFGQSNGGNNASGNLYYQPASEEETFSSAADQYNSYLGDSSVEFYA